MPGVRPTGGIRSSEVNNDKYHWLFIVTLTFVPRWSISCLRNSDHAKQLSLMVVLSPAPTAVDGDVSRLPSQVS
jgi:hypothetical protein